MSLYHIYGDAGRGHRRVGIPLQIWKPIPGWDDLYEISDKGLPARVRFYSSDAKNLSPRVLKVSVTTAGALKFMLRGKPVLIAPIVLAAHVRAREEFEIPHHKDGNLLNCHLINLEWKHYEQCSEDERRAYLRSPVESIRGTRRNK